jgi:hypothetical protein
VKAQRAPSILHAPYEIKIVINQLKAEFHFPARFSYKIFNGIHFPKGKLTAIVSFLADEYKF